jgi:hypothetical protein
MTRDETPTRNRQNKRLEAALTIIAAQLLAVALLVAGYSLLPSLTVPIAAAALFLTRRLIWRAGRWIVVKVCSLSRLAYDRLLDRRTYRFGLRSLLFVILIIAVLSAWFGYRYRAVNLEQHLLVGHWAMFNHDGKPFIAPDGTQYTFDFSDVSYSIDPLSEPRRLDYHTAQGVWRGIYQWDGDELLITQASPGVERPVSFFQRDVTIEPGVGVAGVEFAASVSTFRLRRIGD